MLSAWLIGPARTPYRRCLWHEASVCRSLSQRAAWGYSEVIKSIAQAIEALKDDQQAEAMQ